MDHTGTRPRLRLLLITAIVVLGLMGACLLTIASLDDEGRAAFLAETGPVEIASAGCYIAMAIMLGLFAVASRADRLFAFEFAAFSALLAARELDFHNRFTSEGVFRSSFYFRGESSIPEKIIVSLIMLAILALVVHHIRRYAKRYIAGVLRLAPWVLTLGTGFVLIVMGKAMDSSTWIFESMGVEQKMTISLINAIEESLELAGAGALLTGAAFYIAWAWNERPAQTSEVSS